MSAARSVVSFVDLIFHHALSQPEKPAIILPDRVVTYDMMAQGILRVDDRIAALGLPAGGLVSLSFDSPIRHLIVGSALFRLGHPIVSVTRPDQLAPLQLPVVAVMHEAGVAFIPGQRHVLVDDAWFAGERRPLAASPPKGFADERSICCVALSSGTTGHPKAISLTVKAFQQSVMNYYSTLGLGMWQRLLLLIGLNSYWGYTLAAHALFAGRTLTFAANARESLHMIAVYGADALAATSVQLRELLKQQTREPMPCGSLRTILTGGGLASPEMIADARARLCSSIVNLYGSTEAGGTAFAPCDRLDSEGATGFVAPWAEVEVVDARGNTVPLGTDGMLRIRATCQGAPYPPGTENASFRGGWFYPGDLGRIMPDGLLVLSGRTSEVINVGGYKVAPEAIEETLLRHSAVAEAAAFGSMGAGGIEEISVALVANRPVAEQHLIEWCAARGVPLSRAFFLDALPKTASGKIDRDLLKRTLLDRQNAS
jgi:acyl-coenzyme A synthetase/AMP-(fatty) acid ligase